MRRLMLRVVAGAMLACAAFLSLSCSRAPAPPREEWRSEMLPLATELLLVETEEGPPSSQPR
jgi:hypothetical protein